MTRIIVPESPSDLRSRLAWERSLGIDHDYTDYTKFYPRDSGVIVPRRKSGQNRSVWEKDDCVRVKLSDARPFVGREGKQMVYQGNVWTITQVDSKAKTMILRRGVPPASAKEPYSNPDRVWHKLGYEEAPEIRKGSRVLISKGEH